MLAWTLVVVLGLIAFVWIVAALVETKARQEEEAVNRELRQKLAYCRLDLEIAQDDLLASTKALERQTRRVRQWEEDYLDHLDRHLNTCEQLQEAKRFLGQLGQAYHRLALMYLGEKEEACLSSAPSF